MGSTLGKRGRRPAKDEKEEINDTPIDYKGSHAFMDQLNVAASKGSEEGHVTVKLEPGWRFDEGTTSGFKKAKVEKGSRTKTFADVNEDF
jgi:hypothetical protein